MDTTRRLWIGLAASLIASFSLVLWMGRDVARQWLLPVPSVALQPGLA